MILFDEGVALVLNTTARVPQGARAGQGGACWEWQGRAPRLLAVRPELSMGKVQEC